MTFWVRGPYLKGRPSIALFMLTKFEVETISAQGARVINMQPVPFPLHSVPALQHTYGTVCQFGTTCAHGPGKP